mmetsp:Transcript_27852/g.39322  ORF Transcript_27852/g.39322 Transcript_27852/m.39322 type:complete len:258 (-) Transcript_27852:155-928(-)|eukprot:CAMPEP_0175098718 /NCGR_PEP_ID=MMETSP0086_2-20121207/6024_1 /TAXON_ID=136419 /ORGANISM="Unknown Unknown, Strain D1" /LENGTH=257 /DNA_ID=CAMNT_0016372423 /DNA_START=40 /DNA_END=813 /DNA_ORIENTATION=+
MKLVGFSLLATVALAQMPDYSQCNQAGNLYSGDSNLGGVRLGSINDDTNNCEMTNIVDMTKDSTNLSPGSKYTIEIDATTCGTGYDRKVFAWIDYKGVGNFADPADLLGSASVGASDTAPVTVKFDFTVPSDAGAQFPEARLRVIVAEMAPDSFDPCSQFGYGGAKDFKVVFGGGGMSGGSTFLLICFILGIVYVGGSCFYMRKYKGTTGMAESLIGYSQVASLCSYAKVGCLFTKQQIQAKISGGGGGDAAAFEEL